MSEEDLALDNLKRLICHKTNPNQIKQIACNQMTGIKLKYSC